MTVERVAIIGAGIGGLATALALEGSGRDVVIVERDPPPPDIPPQDAFERWQRPGVPQFRHAHILLARVRTLLRDRYPTLLAELAGAGIETSSLEDGLPANLVPEFRARPDDDDLLHLWGRRATFEYVLRRHVERLPRVRFIHDVRVVGLSTETTAGRLRVRGLELKRGDCAEALEADIVVDASGRRTKLPQWLRERGVRVDVQSEPSGFVYACRHYRFDEPTAAAGHRDGGGNLDYLGYSTFFAEHGHYAVAFGCPADASELSEAIHSRDGFEALCRQFPVLDGWTARSTPMSKVLGAGGFQNAWTRYGGKGGLPLDGFFPVGDSHFETNPMYGRGCASAFVQAEALAAVLASEPAPERRLSAYQRRTRALLQPFFDISVGTDRMYHTRARLARGLPVRAGERILNHLYEAAWLPASRRSLLVAREFLKSVQMREISSLGLRLRMALVVLFTLLGSWLGRSRDRAAEAPPEHGTFLRQLAAGRGASEMVAVDASDRARHSPQTAVSTASDET